MIRLVIREVLIAEYWKRFFNVGRRGGGEGGRGGGRGRRWERRRSDVMRSGNIGVEVGIVVRKGGIWKGVGEGGSVGKIGWRK
jgi:hypothetical protein